MPSELNYPAPPLTQNAEKEFPLAEESEKTKEAGKVRVARLDIGEVVVGEVQVPTELRDLVIGKKGKFVEELWRE